MFGVIYLDPPLKYNDRNDDKTKFGKGAHRYPYLTPQEMFDLRIDKLANKDCALICWATAPKMREYDYMRMFENWGFRYATKIFCWVKVDKNGKPRYLPGYYTGSNSEDAYLAIKGEAMQCIIGDTVDAYLGIRGSMPPVNKGINQIILSPLEEHSKKPDEARYRIEQLFGDQRRVELFARQKYEGWECTGFDVDGKDIRRINEPDFKEL